MPETGKPTEFYPTFRFSVEIEGIGRAAFTECNFSGFQVDYQEIREGGLNEYTHKLPGAVKEGATLTLKRGISSAALLKWYAQVLQGKIEDALRSVTVVVYNSVGQPVFTWHFLKAYPVRWDGPTLNAGESAIALETLELVYHGFTMEAQ